MYDEVYGAEEATDAITDQMAKDLPIQIDDADQTLLWLLRRAGDEWGASGVAKVAAQLARGKFRH